MRILGISSFYHDSAAALVIDGRVAAAAQEERFTRLRHDPGFPRQAIDYCLASQGLCAADLDVVVFYENPWRKLARILDTAFAFVPRGLRRAIRAISRSLRDRLDVPSVIRRELGPELHADICFADHHQSHAASAFLPSPFSRAAFVTVDGVGEYSTTTWGVAAGSTIDVRAELRFPHSLGLLYTAFTDHLGFQPDSGEYKVMGLAPYGIPRFAGAITSHLIDLADDGSFQLDQRYFSYATHDRMTSSRFHRIIGIPPRRDGAPITQDHMDLAASIQRVCEDVMLRIVRHVQRATGEINLCLAGGVALNCVANGRILAEGPFEALWIQPAAGDAGGALGAALLEWHRRSGRPRGVELPDGMSAALLGPSWTSDEAARLLSGAGACFVRHDTEAELLRRVAELLAAGKIIGVCRGRMEFGPRALGNRSILADPRRADVKDVLNEKIKLREAFRPFAPAVLEEDAAQYFDLAVPSPYMLLVARARAGEATAGDRDGAGASRARHPGITHVDGSSRVQTVSARTHPAFHRLLAVFKALTGCGVLVNTSFNIRGEPLVCSPLDAYRCFMGTDLDALVVEDLLCLKDHQPAFAGAGVYLARYGSD